MCFLLSLRKTDLEWDKQLAVRVLIIAWFGYQELCSKNYCSYWSLLSFPDLVLAELSAVGDDNRSHILTSRKTISRVKVSVLLPLLWLQLFSRTALSSLGKCLCHCSTAPSSGHHKQAQAFIWLIFTVFKNKIQLPDWNVALAFFVTAAISLGRL